VLDETEVRKNGPKISALVERKVKEQLRIVLGETPGRFEFSYTIIRKLEHVLEKAIIKPTLSKYHELRSLQNGQSAL
jgi:hypothetical protein